MHSALTDLVGEFTQPKYSDLTKFILIGVGIIFLITSYQLIIGLISGTPLGETFVEIDEFLSSDNGNTSAIQQMMFYLISFLLNILLPVMIWIYLWKNNKKCITRIIAEPDLIRFEYLADGELILSKEYPKSKIVDLYGYKPQDGYSELYIVVDGNPSTIERVAKNLPNSLEVKFVKVADLQIDYVEKLPLDEYEKTDVWPF